MRNSENNGPADTDVQADSQAAQLLPRLNRELFADIFLLEVGLRELIIDRLSTIHGTRWLRTALPGGEIQTKVKEARSYEQRTPWVSYVALHPLYYLDFPELVT